MTSFRTTFVRTLALIGGIVAAAAPAAFAHELGPETAAEHIEEDSVVYSPAQERRLGRHSEAATAADAEAAAAENAAANAGQVGEWGPVVDWPLVGIHVALLENGKVLAYDYIGEDPFDPVHDHTRATVWDPATGLFTPAHVDTGYNLFCSGLAHLMDGSIFLAGGNKNAANDGIVKTHVFDSDTNDWILGNDMAYERWYPSVTPLQNGEMLITEGEPASQQSFPEVRELDGSLRTLDSAPLNLDLYPWIDVAPDGGAFVSGPDKTMHSLDPAGTGSWETFQQRDDLYRSYGSRALYDVGKILVAGGGDTQMADSRVIDLNGATPEVSATESMETGRRQHNLTVLADGSVLATGGLSSQEYHVDLDNGVYTAELWNPENGQWRTLASMQRTRQYHSTALLLPDGRVLSAGGGICGRCTEVEYLERNAEVFTPPYLFKQDGSGDLAPRPEITAAPGKVAYNAPFEFATPAAASIEKVALVRLGSVTHSVNMEQRYVPLDFTAGVFGITATAPANANIAPPGPYMLFAIDDEGVPSEAKMVQVLPGSPVVTPPDTRAPQTQLMDRPKRRTHKPRVRFAFDSDEAGSTFECRLDGNPFKPCKSAWKVTASRGKHRFAIRAIDQAGNADPDPAVGRFRVVKPK